MFIVFCELILIFILNIFLIFVDSMTISKDLISPLIVDPFYLFLEIHFYSFFLKNIF